ncbi:MAG: PucR family transcriptional regulator [Trebonia sp.]
MTTRAPDAIVSARESEVVVFLAGSPDPRKMATALLQRLSELFPGAKVVIGVGGACKDPEEIARSYDQAHRTTQTLGRMGRTVVVSAFEDLGIHRLLLQVPDLNELRAFAREVLGKLSEHEHEHKSEYLVTLACYFRENNIPQRASRLLHVHPNTVAYRIKRIEEITSLRLDNYRDRLIAQVALEILDALPEGQ